MFRWLKLSINGRPLWVEVNGETEHLSGLLRSLGIVGPKAICSSGQCAACTVLVGDRPVRSCAVKTEDCAGKDVTTVERLDDGASVHPMLAAFCNHGVRACTSCMPGMVLAAVAYAARDRELTEDEVSLDLVADVCRCGYADNIVVAVLQGARAMHGRRDVAGEE
jgi:aerobic-type carbon monoxide dehydrogenase small subunit (CoxS/CutS family)